MIGGKVTKTMGENCRILSQVGKNYLGCRALVFEVIGSLRYDLNSQALAVHDKLAVNQSRAYTVTLVKLPER